MILFSYLFTIQAYCIILYHLWSRNEGGGVEIQPTKKIIEAKKEGYGIVAWSCRSKAFWVLRRSRCTLPALARARGGGGELDNLRNKKDQNQLCWLTTNDGW